MKKIIILLALMGLFAFQAQAQSEKEAIKKAINTMFDGMRAGDSAMVHSVIMDDVVFQRVTKNREGNSLVVTSNFQDFLNAVGTPHEEVWDEQIEFGSILIDGDLASVWTPFKFYRGETFSHCGVNSFQLYKTDQGWKIFHLVDTSRPDNCAME